jgi:hypothetical protein
VIHRKIARHFLPHFYVESKFALSFPEPHKVHHRAHALSLFSLFMYLQVLVAVTAGLYVIKLKAPGILGEVTFGADQIIAQTNAKRSENGLAPLASNSLLASAASAKAADMFANDYWAHNSPSGKTPWSFISAAGYRYVFAGENLARDFTDPGSVVNAWMNSPSHRSNLLDKNFREIGVAVVSGELTGREGILVVQMFGSGVSQIPTSQPLAAASPSPQASVAPTAKASILPSPTPEISPVPVPTEVALVPLEFTQTGQSRETTVLATRQFSIAKGVSLALVGFIFMLFALEILVTLRRAHVGLRSGVVAHLSLLGFVMFAVWYAVGGSIL